MGINKEFKKLDEQVEILINKGLTVNNVDYAKEVLLRENYFFLNGYRHLFMKSSTNKTYIEGSTFEELYSLFLFDREFRNILFKNILTIENNVKSVMSYQLSMQYGYHEKDYLDRKNFINNPEKNKQVNDVIRKMKRQIKSNAESHSATMHYVNSYGYIPLWVLVKVLSFGIIGELYSILKREDKLSVADIYDLDTETFANYLVMLSNYRNICAHEDIVFDHKTERVIPDTEFHKKLNIFKMDDEYIYGKDDLFAVIIIFKYLLEDAEFRLMLKEFEYELEKLDGRIDSIPVEKILDTMGIPKNYMDIINLWGDIKWKKKK